MLSPAEFCSLLQKNGLSFFCGVPDSLLKNLCGYIDSHLDPDNHIITANEGNAVALASGHYLGTGNAAVVYMQNSGLGNAVNPLTSLTDPEVYSIPMLLVIGWRGEPGVKDEPQHVKQGAITEAQLKILGIRYLILDSENQSLSGVEALLGTMKRESRPVAILVRKGTFSHLCAEKTSPKPSLLKREAVLEQLLSSFDEQDLIVSTTGKTSREVYEIRQRMGQTCADFLTVGAMGHASSIALGIALSNPRKRVITLDGDGALLMHMGSLPVLANARPGNFVHVVLNNGCHESVGGQPTVANNIDITKIALASGYSQSLTVEDAVELHQFLDNISSMQGPMLVEVKIAPGSRADLGRPQNTPVQNKAAFMQKVGLSQ